MQAGNSVCLEAFAICSLRQSVESVWNLLRWDACVFAMATDCELTCFKTPIGTLLNVIVTSNSNQFLQSGSLNTGLSDFHHLVYDVLHTGFPKASPWRVCYRPFKNINVENYNADAAQAPFHVMEIFEDIDDSTWFYDMMHRDIPDSHAPLKSRMIRPNQSPFMNSALRKAAHRKAQLQNKANRFPNTIHFEKYRVQRIKTTSIRRKAIKGFYGENCNVNCRNYTNYYKAIKPFMGKNAQNSDSIQLLQNDRLVTDPVQVANVFNDFQVNITKHIASPTEDKTDLSDLEYVQYSIDKYQNLSSVICIRVHLEQSNKIASFSFTEVSIETVEKTL